jgi:cytoplasmic iron level regulating protein YaaA (DUF328/UPF0246 family)
LARMISVISPAKTLDFEEQRITKKHSDSDFLEESQLLINKLAKLSRSKLKALMGISDSLAELNSARYRSWSVPFTQDNAKQALLAFKGDVYTGFDLEGWRAADFDFAQKHLRILSGLYGVLRPLDLMQAYRLEMGTELPTRKGKDLYAFWGDKITAALNEAISKSRSEVLVNLASNEYFRSVKLAKLDAEVVTPVFKDFKNGKYKIISFFAKKARGSMANYIVRNRAKAADDLKGFDVGGYRFDADGSDGKTLLFLRDPA